MGRSGCRAVFLLACILGSFPPPPAGAQVFEEPRIERIECVGNQAFDDETLEAQMLLEFPSWLRPFRSKPRYRRNVFPKEMRRIEAFYRRQGFGGASVWLDSLIALSKPPKPGTKPRGEEKVALVLGVREGPRTLLREVRYTPQQVLSLEELRRSTPIEPGHPYPFGAAHRGHLTRALRIAYLSRGYLGVSVADSTILAADSTEAVLYFKIEPGPQYHIRNVRIAGNEQTGADVIHHELTFAPGEVYDYTRVQESEQNLYSTVLFRRVTIREESLDAPRRSVDIAVRVEERKMTFVEGSVGIGRRNNYEAHAIGRFGLRNLWGRGHALEWQSTVSYDLEQGGDNYFVEQRMRYVDRYFFGAPVRLVPQLAYSIDRRSDDVELNRVRFDLPAFWKGGRYTQLSFGPFASFTTTTLEEESDDLLETRALTFGVSRNSTDNLFDPHRGDVRSLSLQRAGFGGDNHFNRVTGSFTRTQRLGPTVLAFGLRAGWVESFGPSREASAADIGIAGVPFEFLFQAGGNTTVRGFDNNSLGPLLTITRVTAPGEAAVVDTFQVHAGTTLLLGNAELRVPLPLFGLINLGSVVFLDAGNVWRDTETLGSARFGLHFDDPYAGPEDMRYSYGFGLRYGTPFGPIRVDLGFPIKRNGRRIVHLGIGHAF
ncbi:MAG TPA: BamA/TamA family outer membrane protein [Candidatus Krumholzibacteria bacterium]|nr:BamA/TamA family outer membrane protein [Candidatus Krumholzibacteria bacterium]